MSIVKRSKIKGKVIVSSTMLECPKCGHKDVSDKIEVYCPQCNVKMIIACYSAGGD